MPKSPGPTPAQRQLAHDLWAAGLAPRGVTRQMYYEYTVYWSGERTQWEPWRSWDAVAHLIRRYGIDITTWGTAWTVAHPDLESTNDEIGLAFTDIPAAVCRLALRLRHAEISAQNQKPAGDFGQDDKSITTP